MNSKRKNPNRPRPNQIRIEGVESSTRQLIFICACMFIWLKSNKKMKEEKDNLSETNLIKLARDGLINGSIYFNKQKAVSAPPPCLIEST